MDSIQRGERAKQLLNDDLLVDSLEIIEQGILDTWKNSSDKDIREQSWYALQGMELFEKLLEVAVETGEFDKTKLELDRQSNQSNHNQ